MDYFKELQGELNKYLNSTQIDLIQEAYSFAEVAHRRQYRMTGEPYIIHPVKAALILAEMRMDHQTIMATLLHDVLEDTSISKSFLTDNFNQEIADLVDGVSKLKQIKFNSKAEAQAENFRKMVMAMVKDIRVILVKLADRLHNIRTLSSLPLYKQKRIALETLEIYAPIANRLGIHKIYIELEDLCFEALYPMRYRVLKNVSQEIIIANNEMLRMIKDTITKALVKHDIADFKIFSRTKHLYSTYKKMLVKRNSFKDIMDMYGIRLVVNNKDLCYRALGIIHSLYKPLSKGFKDYIAIPKSNSYQSLHTILFGPFGIPIEIQIRTKEMHKIAEIGIAAHWIYKSKNEDKNNQTFLAMGWMKELAEIEDNATSPLDFIESVKIELFPDEVYVFTPNGDIVKLPQNATPVDFAYYVHSEVGNECVGSKINKRFAPLNTRLVSGQTVEIITSPDGRPHESWLEFVCTSRARNGIRHYIRDKQKYESEALGKRVLEQELANFQIGIDNLGKHNINSVLNELQLENIESLYREIGLGNQYPVLIARKLTRGTEYTESNLEQKTLLIKGTEGMVVHFSECCYPIPGDLVIGHLRSGHGIDVHLETCNAVVNYRRHPESYLNLAWSSEIVGEFKVEIIVEVINQKRALASLASVISDSNSNIDNIIVDPRLGSFIRVYLTISVIDRIHLAYVIKKIKNLKFVVSQSRKKQ